MKKIAFLFPGQGVQFPGMGKDFFDTYQEAQEVFNTANKVLGFDITSLIFEGTKEDLQRTEITQPAVLVTSLAVYKVLTDHYHIYPAGASGLSLGEYSALAVSGVLKLSEAVSLVQKRARFMQEAVPEGEGSMAAILGLNKEKVKEVCKEGEHYGIVSPANYNCPGQVVIAGEKTAVEKTVELAKQAGAKRAVILPMSVPSHCELLRSAGERLSAVLQKVSAGDFKFPVLSNVKARYYNTPGEIRELLVLQLSSPVLWQDSMEFLIKDGFNYFIEVGPGRTLSAFLHKINRKVESYHVEDKSSLEKLLNDLEVKR